MGILQGNMDRVIKSNVKVSEDIQNCIVKIADAIESKNIDEFIMQLNYSVDEWVIRNQQKIS